MKYIVGGLLIVVAGAALIWFLIFYQTVSAPAEVTFTDERQDATMRDEKKVPLSVMWDFRLIEDGVSDPVTPQTDVGVVLTRGAEEKTQRLGSYTGSCAEQSIPEGSDSSVVGYALCWWAGFGTEFYIRDTVQGVVVESREVDEGSPETGGQVKRPMTTEVTIAL